MKERIRRRLTEFEGSLIIYGAGVHAGLTLEFLERMGLDDKVKCCCISKNQNSIKNMRNISVKCIDEIDVLKNNSLVLVPGGAYASDMICNLETNGWDLDHFILIPEMIIFDNVPDCKADIGNILRNKDNHFITYGTEWYNTPLRDMMIAANRHFDFSISELGRETLEDLRYVASIKNVYVIVFSGVKKRKALKAGVPEEKIIQICNMDEILYFDEEIVPKHVNGEREVFVDGGSLNLYNSEQFMRWCNYECDKIIAFEPDKRCVKLCEELLQKRDRLREVTQLIPKGLGFKEAEVAFNVYDAFGASSFIFNHGNGNEYMLPITSIDKMVKGDLVTFIKMDIEGMELEALKGAEKTIRKYHPKLAISIYHKPEDIVELPQYIKSINPEYKLYLRNYHMDNTETVLYAF